MNLERKLIVFSKNYFCEAAVTKTFKSTTQWFVFLFEFIDNSRDWLVPGN